MHSQANPSSPFSSLRNFSFQTSRMGYFLYSQFSSLTGECLLSRYFLASFQISDFPRRVPPLRPALQLLTTTLSFFPAPARFEQLHWRHSPRNQPTPRLSIRWAGDPTQQTLVVGSSILPRDSNLLNRFTKKICFGDWIWNSIGGYYMFLTYWVSLLFFFW